MLPIRKMRPAATLGVTKPPPLPVTFQSSLGPSLGHDLSRPVSCEIPLRRVPCHCGQSNLWGQNSSSSAKSAGAQNKTAARHRAQGLSMETLLEGIEAG